MMYKVTLEECLTIDGVLQPVPNVNILDAINEFHLFPINTKVRGELDHPIYVRSCYRSLEHEIKNKRSGNSQHTFLIEDGKGAIDLSVTPSSHVDITPELRTKMFQLAQLLLQVGYKRLAFYPTKFFIHADYASEKRQFNISDDFSKWKECSPEQFYSKIVGDH